VRDELNTDGDIEIKYSGCVRRELYEELLIGNNVSGTEHPLIMWAKEIELPWSFCGKIGANRRVLPPIRFAKP